METIDSLCRTCLQVLDKDDVTNVQYDIFKIPELAKKLTVCTTFNVDPTDEYPKQLCDYCFHKLNDFYEFRTMCIESMERFGRMLQIFEEEKPIFSVECVEFESNVKMEIIDDEDSLASDEDKGFEENDEAEETDAEGIMDEDEEVIEQLNKESDAEENVFVTDPINVLDEALPVKGTKVTHSQREKPPEKCIVKQEFIADEQKKYLDDDVDWSSEQYDSDENCTLPISRKTQKRLSDSNKLCCDICPARFRRKERLEAHKREHDGLVPYACPHNGCKKVFRQFCGFSSHLKDHEGIISYYRCDVDGCDKVYKLKRSLANHKESQHNPNADPKRFLCNICGKDYSNSNALKDHQYTHKDKSEWPFACNQPNCTGRFVNKTRLDEHLLRHSGIKNFVCTYCGVRRATNKELKLHVNTHTHERKYHCSLCTKVFYKSGLLTKHVKAVHKGLKPYGCRYCEQTFASSYNRKDHEKRHAKIGSEKSLSVVKPYKCEVCGKGFKTNGRGLKRHIKKHQLDNVSIEVCS